MKLVVLLRKPTEKEKNNLKRLQPERIVYRDRNYLDPDLEYLDCHYQEFSEDRKKTVESTIFERIVDFGHHYYFDKRVIDWLSHKEHTLWYNIRFIVYNRYRAQYFNQTYVTDVVKRYGGQLDQIIIISESQQHFDVSGTKDVKVLFAPKSKWNPIYAKLKFVVVFLMRACSGMIQFLILNKKNPYHVIITHPFYRQNMLSMSSGKRILGDPHIENLLEKVKKDKNFIFLSEGHPPRLDDPAKIRISAKLFFYHFLKSLSVEWFLFLSLFSKEYWRRRSDLDDIFQKLDACILSNSTGFEIWNQVKTVKPLLKFVLLYEQAAQRLFGSVDVKSLSTTNEHGSNNKAILNVGKIRNIPTCGIQHGAVYLEHMEYHFDKRDSDFDPFPSHTIVWGDKWRETLVNDCGYYEDRLKVLGQLRTDQIDSMREQSTQGSERPLVLYASQPLFEGEEKTRALNARRFLEASKKLPAFEFVIKPHPAEKDYQLFFDSIASQVGTRNYRFYVDDLYSILNQVQVVVVYYSTVGNEAIYFNKPLLVLDFDQKDLAGYIKHKVALPCSSLSELNENISTAIKSPETITMGYEKYIAHSSFKIDGQVAERYYQFIKGLDSQ